MMSKNDVEVAAVLHHTSTLHLSMLATLKKTCPAVMDWASTSMSIDPAPCAAVTRTVAVPPGSRVAVWQGSKSNGRLSSGRLYKKTSGVGTP